METENDALQLIRRKLAKVRRSLNEALKEGQDVPWKDDDRELLSHSVGQVREAAEALHRSVANRS